jgi:2-polyprenyl-3-methyl-5-hydroxy-6-metoxy-1,4-benzoquinol methylase
MRKFIWFVKLILKTPDFKINKIDYNEYWKHKGEGFSLKSKPNEWQVKRAKIIVPYLKEGMRTLDFGTGDGLQLKEILSQVTLNNLCVDISEDVISFLVSSGFNAKKMNLIDEIQLLESENYDSIFMFEFLEHVPNPEELLISTLEIAKKFVFFSVPNSGFLAYRLRLFFLGRFIVQWRNHPAEHLRFWSIIDMKWWLSCLKISNSKVISYGGIPILNRVFPNLFAAGILVVINKSK